VRFSAYARRVTLLVRGPDLQKSMSQYLINRVSSLSNVDVRTGSAVIGVEGDGRLRQLVVASDDLPTERVPADALFVCIGGAPRTEGVTGIGLVTDDAGYLVTGSDLGFGPWPGEAWTLPRQPFPLETNLLGARPA
jgi:thioredoxin reductase (NADPH)